MNDKDRVDELLRVKPKCKISSMPSADVVAEERARELQYERELRQLSADASLTDVRLSDSDGSKGEVAASDELDALPARIMPPSLARLLCALASFLPDEAHALLEHAAQGGALCAAVSGAGALVARDGETWARAEVLGVGALLAAAALAHDAPPAARVPALRALHTLLDCRATEQQAAELVCALVQALHAPRHLLLLGDVLRSGGTARTDRLAGCAFDAALATLLDIERDQGDGTVSLERVADAAEARWSKLSAAAAYVTLQLLARRLAAPRPTDGAASARLLRTLHSVAHGRETQCPDLIKVMVAASRLQQFFRVSERVPARGTGAPVTSLRVG